MKKGNIAAAVVLVAVVAAVGVLMTNVTPNTEEAPTDQLKVETEADNAMQTALRKGIVEWLENGFSYENSAQYCNYPVPPGVEEARESLLRFMQDSVTESMENLRKENPQYYIDENLEVALEAPTDRGSLPDRVTVSVSSFNVGLQSDEFEQHADISKPYNYNWPVWQLWDTIYSWHEDDAGSLHEHMVELAFRANPCQLVSGDCQCEIADFSEAAVREIQLTEEDVARAVQASVDELNALFADSDVSCSFELDPLKIQNNPQIDWTLTDQANLGTYAVDYHEDRYDYPVLDFVESTTIPDEGCPVPEGDPNPSDSVVRPDVEAERWVTDTYDGEEVRTFCSQTLLDVREAGINNGADSGVLDGDLAQAMKVGMLGMNKYASFLAHISCSDGSVQVEGIDQLEDLTAQFAVRFSGMQECPLPRHIIDLNGPNPHQCPGGGGGGGGIFGIFCPTPCPQCEGCVLTDESNPTAAESWSCEGPIVGFQCDNCALCGEDGACSLPNPGAPCGGQDCSVCGATPGECLVGDPAAEGQVCDSVACAVCNNAGECVNPVEDDMECNDGSPDSGCRYCEAGGAVGSCETRPNPEGIHCDNCAVCGADGRCNAPAQEDTNNYCQGDLSGQLGLDSCFVCSDAQAGVCVSDPGRSCGRCMRCGPDGCEADPTQNGNSCGSCKVCSDGACVADTAQDGQACGSPQGGCERSCQAGSCVTTNVGATCVADSDCGLAGTCGNRGQCVPADTSLKCCGSLTCGSTDPCCNVGGWTCEECPETT